MASSSDWIAAADAAGDAAQSGPKWLEQIGASAGFVEGFPGAAARAAPASEQSADSDEERLALAFAEGEAAGRAALRTELEIADEQARSLKLAFRTLDAEARDALAGELSDTVLALCEQVLSEHAIDQAGLRDRCERAAKRIGSAAGDLTLHLHPDDLAMLGEEFTASWTCVPDAELSRGDVRLVSDDGAVGDGPREWRRAIAAALAG